MNKGDTVKVSYCDLCGCPIHKTRYLMVVLADEVLGEREMNAYNNANFNHFKDIEKKEICSECKIIIDTLFEEKQKALKKITQEIKRLYSLSASDSTDTPKKG